MSDTAYQVFEDQERSNWVRLQTLVRLRWFAIVGQTFAIIVAAQFYALQIETGFVANQALVLSFVASFTTC